MQLSRRVRGPPMWRCLAISEKYLRETRIPGQSGTGVAADRIGADATGFLVGDGTAPGYSDWEVEMHNFGRWTLTMAVLVLWATPARPAEEKMVPGEGAIEVMMLRQKSVQ